MTKHYLCKHSLTKNHKYLILSLYLTFYRYSWNFALYISTLYVWLSAVPYCALVCQSRTIMMNTSSNTSHEELCVFICRNSNLFVCFVLFVCLFVCLGLFFFLLWITIYFQRGMLWCGIYQTHNYPCGRYEKKNSFWKSTYSLNRKGQSGIVTWHATVC